jgi:diaminohydroxyphosphoribosylaminopyrimidine deaminase / 5-amino-6-(5-phosphoribosylamino)uracil reductase
MQTPEQFMRRALELAELGRGQVEPNPMVGCVVVRDGKIVGEGYHQKFGGPHAEINAMAAASNKARGATLFVTLEPCSTYGKTPPCADAIISAGVAHVVVGATDPTQSGLEKLRAAGVAVTSGILEAECRDLIRPFVKLNQTQRPYVIAKWAMSLDGKMATPPGETKWISGEASRALVHRWRREIDAIAVGIGTVLSDDPLLTARIPQGRNPVRIVLDSNARTPLSSKLVATINEAPLIIAVAENAPEEQVAALRNVGCEILPLPRRHRQLDLDALLQNLGARRITNLMIEGGASVLGSAFRANIVDEVRIFIAPTVLGGAGTNISALCSGAKNAAEARKARNVNCIRSGDDILLTAIF